MCFTKQFPSYPEEKRLGTAELDSFINTFRFLHCCKVTTFSHGKKIGCLIGVREIMCLGVGEKSVRCTTCC